MFLVKANNGSSVDIEIHATDILSSQHGDDRHINACLASCWLALLADSPLYRLKGTYPPARLIARFRAAIKPDTIIETIELYSRLSHEIVSSVYVDPKRGSQKGAFLPQMKDTAVFAEYNYWYKTGDAEVLRYLLSFLNYGKKAEYPYEYLNQVAFHAWQSVEERLAKFVVPEGAECLREILAQILPNPSVLAKLSDKPRILSPKFGSGSVAEKRVRGTIRKISSLRYDALVDRAIFTGGLSLAKQLGLMEGIVADTYFPMEKGRWTMASQVRSKRVARLYGVPKSYKTSRLICMEPNTFMLAQQCVLAVFSELISCSETISRFVDLSDQTRNQRAAEFGSITGEVDTIDLSSASDSVHGSFVKSIFPRWAAYLLFGTRTSKVRLLDGKTIQQVHKFAPMGSALCFPVQCLVFTTICIYAAFLHHRGLDASGVLSTSDEIFSDVPRSIDMLFGKHYGDYHGIYHPLSVYGDDICVDHKLTPIVVDLLTRFGFEVNLQKSFTGGQCYRESCGKHYMDGDDVTPLYWRGKNLTDKLNEKSLPSLCAMTNRSLMYGYKTTRSYLIHYLHTIGNPSGHNAILFTNHFVEGLLDARIASAILTTQVLHRSKRWNGRPAVTSRYNPDYQIWETGSLGVGEGSEVVRPKPASQTGELSDQAYALESYLYLQWVNAASKRGDVTIADDIIDGGAAPRRDVLNSALRWRWTPSD